MSMLQFSKGRPSSAKPSEISPEDLLTLKEAREMLHCGRTKLYELMKSGELPSLTIGGTRFTTRQYVAAYLGQRAKLSRPPGRGR